MGKFIPKQIICTVKTERFKYTCKNIHLDEQSHEINNTYRFNKNVPYLVKNEEDYNEMISLDMFIDYDSDLDVPETEKEKKDREKAEDKAKKEAEKKVKEEAKKEAAKAEAEAKEKESNSKEDATSEVNKAGGD